MHHRIFPSRVFRGIKFLIHHHIGLLNFGIRARHETEMDLFRRIPTELKRAIPQEVAGETERERFVVELFEITFLQFVIASRQIRENREILRQRIDAKIANNAQPRRT